MEVKEAIRKRRAYRSLKDVTITEELIEDLTECAQFPPSRFNKQRWCFVFVYTGVLESLCNALSKGNQWAHSASMITAVIGRKDLDYLIKEREYYFFDTGVATAFILLRATERELGAHLGAGHNEGQVKEILHIPQDLRVIILVVESHSEERNPVLTERKIHSEMYRPDRPHLKKFIYLRKFEEV